MSPSPNEKRNRTAEPGGKTGLYLVIVYKDLEGSAQINRIEPLTLGDMDSDEDDVTDAGAEI